MASINFNDLGDHVFFDLKSKQYKLIGAVDELPFYLQGLVQKRVGQDKTLELPAVEELLQKVYPFFDSPQSSVIDQIIVRNQKIRELVQVSLREKKSEKLAFFAETEKDPFVLEMAREFVYALNKLIYKYDLTNLYGYKTLINNDINHPFIGTIDVVAKNKQNEWYLFLLKTSKTNYLQKYFAEAFLQKTLLESNTKIKIKESFILNPRQERYLLKVVEISNSEKFALLN